MNIAQECLSVFERHKLNSVGNLEQVCEIEKVGILFLMLDFIKNIATGETSDGETPKTIVLDMVPLLDDSYVR